MNGHELLSLSLPINLRRSSLACPDSSPRNGLGACTADSGAVESTRGYSRLQAAFFDGVQEVERSNRSAPTIIPNEMGLNGLDPRPPFHAV